MARVNRGEDGKPLTYAEKNRERILNGEAPRAQEQLDELDQADVQEKILTPDEIKIELTAGGRFCVRKALGPSAVKKRHAVDCLRSLTELLVLETAKLSGDLDTPGGEWFGRNQPYLRMAAKRFNVQLATVEAANALGNGSYAIDEFVEASLSEATFSFFAFFLEHMVEVDKQPKNAPAK